MTNSYLRFALALPLAVLATALPPATGTSQVSFRVIAVMGQYQQPAGLAEGDPEVFYSTGGGYAFSINSRGTTSQLAAFANGYNLYVMVSASNGRFYSSLYAFGGSVVNLFSVSAKPNSATSYSQQSITAVLTQNLPDGALLGTGGGQSSGLFYLVKSDLNGDLTPIYQFPSGEVLPNNAIYATDGNYYGAAWIEHSGGTTGTSGYIYRVTPSGALTKLYTLPSGTFTTNASNFVPILQGSDGNLYGATTAGGANGYGSVYRLTLDGQYTTLYSFAKGPSSYPQSLIQASDGNLFAATLGYSYTGQISRVTTSGQYTPLHQMTGSSGQCECLIIQGSDGIIYGTAIQGGGAGGTVFALDAGLPKPAPKALSFSPAEAAAGTRVRIWGYNMLRAAVEFNGVPAAAVSNSGPNYVWATVPAGATTGPITVTTPGGTSTTQASFTVR
jgi:uncharacterized repeat protein (TIGR03803 family)